MIAPDTNVLVRFLVRDDERQFQRVVALLRGEGPFFVGDVVLAELVWVLQATYGHPRSDIADALQGLTESERLVFESTDRCARALRRYRAGRGGFADYLLAERAADAGCGHVVTFDRDLCKETGFRGP